MDADKLAEVVAAIEMIAEAAGGSLDRKPNVADVEAQGVSVTKEERDEAWATYRAGNDSPSEASNEPEAASAEPEKAKPARGRAPAFSVTNHHTSALSIRGVTIPAGETRDVAGFDRQHGVLKRWIAAGVISAS